MPTPDGANDGAVRGAAMRFSVLLPDSILFETDATKIVAEATDGSFALLPRHLDWVAPIVPSLVLVTELDGRETVIGTDEGMLVKCGAEVCLATRRAVVGDDLGTMRQTIATRFRSVDEHEAAARSALARLESGIVRRFVELEEKR